MSRQKFIEQYNRLTSFLLKRVSVDTGNKNIVFSPFSILSLLSILADATNNTTRREIENCLYGNLSHTDFTQQMKISREELTRKNEETYSFLNTYGENSSEMLIPDRSTHFHTANAVCVREDIRESILPNFRVQLRDIYDGIIIATTNMKDGMMSWLSEMILDDIRPLVEEILKSDSEMAFINTVSFDAMWQTPYSDENVRMGMFHNIDGSNSRVFMLYGSGAYLENDVATGFVKDFQQCDYSFMALLPKEEGSEALNSLVTSVDFRELMTHQKNVILHSMIPEFSVSFKKNLNQVVKSLGIKEVFTDNADFSSSVSTQLKTDQVIHQAKFELNQNGVRASAATAMVYCGSQPSKKKRETKYVLIDRPFVFAIIHMRLQIPVFVGVVNYLEDDPDLIKNRMERIFEQVQAQLTFR